MYKFVKKILTVCSVLVGTVIDRLSAKNDQNVPIFFGEDALLGWKKVVDKVHQAIGQMGPQLWHMGISDNHGPGWMPPATFEGAL